MLYIDYIWDLDPSRLIFDKELDLTKQLGWKPGDWFQLVEYKGQFILIKAQQQDATERNEKCQQ